MLDKQAKLKHLRGVFALDLGTTKFCIASLRDVPGKSEPSIDHVMVPADGMRRGMLAHAEAAKKALCGLLEAAEKHFGSDITRVVVGIAGAHLGGRTVQFTVPCTQGVVGTREIEALIAKADTIDPGEGREILHAVPTSFHVDGRESLEEPLGMNGRELSASFFVIDADRFYLKDVVDLCNACGLQVEHLYAEPFASASVTVPDSYKQLGVALADIGGGTTDGVVFKGGRPVSVFTFNVAGALMTNDVAIGLNIEPAEAETVKMRFGVKPRAGDGCDITDVGGRAKHLTGEHVVSVLLPRVHELGILLAKHLQPFRGGLGAGILLTGGGAGVHGITEYYQSKMGVPVARAKPVLNFDGDDKPANIAGDQIVRSPHPTKLATCIGLLNLELCRLYDSKKNRKISWPSRYIGQFFNWIKELS